MFSDLVLGTGGSTKTKKAAKVTNQGFNRGVGDKRGVSY